MDQASGLVMSGQFINLLWLSLSMEFMLASDLQVEGTFWLFGAFSMLGAIFVWAFIKETRGLTDAAKKAVYSPVAVGCE